MSLPEHPLQLVQTRNLASRIHLNIRDNSRPGAKITTFDFVSAMSESGPFLIAVTVE
jgi:hypothetical protein